MKRKNNIEVICYKIDEAFINHCRIMEECFLESLKKYKENAPSFDFQDYDYVQIIPKQYYKIWDSANNGSQGYRHKKTGWTVPVSCIQSGNTPKMWIKTNSSNRIQLKISDNSPIWDFIKIK